MGNEDKKKAVERSGAVNSSVDIWMLRDNLQLSYEERIARHQDTIDCVDALHEMVNTKVEPTENS